MRRSTEFNGWQTEADYLASNAEWQRAAEKSIALYRRQTAPRRARVLHLAILCLISAIALGWYVAKSFVHTEEDFNSMATAPVIKRWTVGDWAYSGYELVQIKEIKGSEVHCVSDGFFSRSGNHLEEWLFPQTINNKRIAETIEIYWDRVRNARGGCMLNHPDLNRKFEEFAFRAMSAVPELQEQREIMEEASEFQRQCSEKLEEAICVRVGDVYIFNRNQPY